MRRLPPGLLPALCVGCLLGAALDGTAWGAPRVGVAVLEHEGLTDDQADELAYDTAAAVAQRIEGEAIAGPTVRSRLGEPVPPGCQDRPACGRDISARLKTDEVLFVVVKRAGKRDLDVTFHRIARDPERIPSDQAVRLVGGVKARREKPFTDAAAALYPPGSVVPFVEAPPPPPPDPDEGEEGQAATKTKAKARAKQAARDPVDGGGSSDSVTHRAWFWPVVVGGAVVVVGGIIALTIWETRPGPTGAPITLP